MSKTIVEEGEHDNMTPWRTPSGHSSGSSRRSSPPVGNDSGTDRSNHGHVEAGRIRGRSTGCRRPGPLRYLPPAHSGGVGARGSADPCAGFARERAAPGRPRVPGTLYIGGGSGRPPPPPGRTSGMGGRRWDTPVEPPSGRPRRADRRYRPPQGREHPVRRDAAPSPTGPAFPAHALRCGRAVGLPGPGTRPSL